MREYHTKPAFPRGFPVRETCFAILVMVFLIINTRSSAQESAPLSPVTAPKATQLKATVATKAILLPRIHQLEGYLEERKGLPKKKERIARVILKSYQLLLKASSDSLALEDRERLLQLLFNSLVKIEAVLFQSRIPETRELFVSEDVNNGALPYETEELKQRNSRDYNGNERSIRVPVTSEQAPERVVRQTSQKRSEKAGKTPLDLNGLLEEVNTLILSQRYGVAERLLSEAEEKAGTAAARSIISGAREQISLEKKARFFSDKKGLKSAHGIAAQANDLLEAGQYEEAIKRLHGVDMAAEDSKDGKLARMKEEAINNLVNRERNRAARFYLKSKKTRDPDEKREALLISRDILSDIILSYPDSSQIGKVKQNVKVVEQALRKVE